MASPFSQQKAWMIFHDFVDFLQIIFLNICNILYASSLYLWNCVGRLTVYHPLQIFLLKLSHGGEPDEQRSYGRGAALFIPPGVPSGPNTLSKEQSRAEQRHSVEKCCLSDTLKVLEPHGTKNFFCKSLLSPFRFRRSKAKLHLLQYNPPKHKKKTVVSHFIKTTRTFRTPYQTVLHIEKTK